MSFLSETRRRRTFAIISQLDGNRKAARHFGGEFGHVYGLEAQTRRLIEVRRQREPLDILDEIERELGVPRIGNPTA